MEKKKSENKEKTGMFYRRHSTAVFFFAFFSNLSIVPFEAFNLLQR